MNIKNKIRSECEYILFLEISKFAYKKLLIRPYKTLRLV